MIESMGQRIRRARKDKKWSQKTLSEVSGVHIQAISKYERDLCVPSILSAQYIAESLGVSLDWIAGRPGATRIYW